MNKKSIVPVILSLASLVGVGLTAYFCKKETPDADMALDAEETRRKQEAEEKGTEPEEMTMLEKAKVMAPHYKKTIAAVGGTAVCIASGQIVSIAAISGALASAYAWQHKYLNLDAEVRKKAMEIKDQLGKDIRNEIKKETAKKEVESIPKKEAKKLTGKKAGEKIVSIGTQEMFEVFDDITGHAVTITKYRATCVEDWLNRTIAKERPATVYEYLKKFSVPDSIIKDVDPVFMLKNKGWDIASTESAILLDKNPDGMHVDIVLDYIRTEGGDDIPIMFPSVPPVELDADRWFTGAAGVDPMMV